MDLTLSIEQNKNNVQSDLENNWILIRSHWKELDNTSSAVALVAQNLRLKREMNLWSQVFRE